MKNPYDGIFLSNKKTFIHSVSPAVFIPVWNCVVNFICLYEALLLKFRNSRCYEALL